MIRTSGDGGNGEVSTPLMGDSSSDREWPEPVGATANPLADFFVSEAEQQPRRSDRPRAETPGGRVDSVVRMLVLQMDDERYAVEISEIQEIIKVPLMTEVPRAPKSIRGVFSLRGTIVPVADLACLVGLSPRVIDRHSRVIVLRGEGEPAGLLVDAVCSVARFSGEAVQPVPKAMQPRASTLLRGVARDAQQLLIVLDVSAVLESMEYRR